MADHLGGLQVALGLQVAVVAGTVGIGLLLPGEAYLRDLRERRLTAAAPVLAAGE